MVQPRAEGRIEIEASEHQAERLCELVAGAERIVRILSNALDPQLFDNAGLAAELSRVARRGRQCEVRILIKDSYFLVKRSHRIAALHRRLVSSLLIRKLIYCPENFVANYVVVDDHGVFFIPNDDDKVCFMNPDDRALAKYYIEQFDDLWNRSSTDPDLQAQPM